MLYFHFHLALCIFKIFFESSSLAHGLFSSIFVKFPGVWRFIEFQLDSIMVTEHNLYDISSLKFVEVLWPRILFV